MKTMNTWFKLPVCCMPSDVGAWMEHVNFGVKGLSSHHCEAIEDAINNHDRLAEENAKLRHELANLIYAAENNTGHEPSLSCFHRAIDEANILIKTQLTEQNNENL